ncbi:MAG: flagellar hook-length control protein FliK [Planctomycetota bacterium]
MDTNGIISLNNVILPEPTQVTVDFDFMVEEFSSDFSQAFEQAQVETEQSEPQQEPEIENEPVPDEQIQIAPTEPSDNNQSEQPISEVSEQNAQGTEPQSVRNALEKTLHLPEKENFEQLVEKIPHWSNSIILAHAGITRQPPPGKAETTQLPVVNSENSTQDLTTVVSEQKTPLETQVQVNINPDISLTTETSETGNPSAASSENAQLVEIITESTQTEQIQSQPLSAQDVVSQPNVVVELASVPQAEQAENVQQPVAEVIVNNEQTQQAPYDVQNISVSVEPEPSTQQNSQLPIENNPVILNVAQQVSQDNSTSVEQNLNTSQESSTVVSQTVPEQPVSENNTSNSQTQTQQEAKSEFTIDSLLNKSDPEQLQITSTQVTNSTTQTVETNIDTASQQIISSAVQQNQDIEPAVLTQETENQDSGMLLNTASAKVGQQIQESIQSSFSNEQQQITINLQPPELGKVTIKFEQQGDDITGQLEVTKAETKTQIAEQLPEIIRNLADAGIQIKRIDVNLVNQYEQNGYKEQSSQDMFLTDQQYQSQQQPDNYETPQQLTAAEQLFPDFESQPQELEHEGSLNMLV